MGRIIGISSSLRRASFNSMLLHAASQVAPDGTTVEIASIRDIPLYDGDVESAEGIPAPVRELKTRIAEADGLLIVTPEYNNSIPGVLKNAIDWLSRPAVDIPKVFGGRPVALIGATPGPAGTSLDPGRVASGLADAWHSSLVVSTTIDSTYFVLVTYRINLPSAGFRIPPGFDPRA